MGNLLQPFLPFLVALSLFIILASASFILLRRTRLATKGDIEALEIDAFSPPEAKKVVAEEGDQEPISIPTKPKVSRVTRPTPRTRRRRKTIVRFNLKTELASLEKRASQIGEEGTLRQDFVEAINRFVEEGGLPKEVRAAVDQRLVTGRPDARIGGLVFEVKLPKPNGPGLEAAIPQARNYLKEFAKAYPGKKARGIGYDGLEMALLDETGHIIARDRPARLSIRLESWLLTLAGEIIAPEDFVARLGPKSPLAAHLITHLWESFHEHRATVGFIDEVYKVWQGLYGVATNLTVEAVRGLRRAASLMGIDLRSKAHAEEYLFVVQTYLAILLKLLVARVAVQVRLTAFTSLGTLFQDRQPIFLIENLERSVPRLQGVFEEDVFLWPADVARLRAEAQRTLDNCLRDMARNLDDVDLAGVSTDFLRLVYQQFFDRTARRALGEFYTSPDLVDETLDAVGFEGELGQRLADITCGSGTFLLRAIERVIRRNGRAEPSALLQAITENVIGVDIHPFAVAMARVNYILAIAELLPGTGPVRIPIFWADSLLRLTPVQPTMDIRLVEVTIPNLEKFWLPNPRVVNWPDLLRRVKETISIFKTPLDPEAVWSRFWEDAPREEYLPFQDTIKRFVERIVERQNEKRDTRWLPLLRNTLSVERLKASCDFIVGNPPWVRIHNISPEIRDRLFNAYAVCKSAGWDRGARLGGARLGFARQIDYSMAFVERGMEFLKPGGRLGFVITSKIMHALYGNALRKALLEKTKVLRLSDYSLFAKPLFEDATNYPLIIAFEMGEVKDDHQVPVAVTGPRGDKMEFTLSQGDLPLLSNDNQSPWALVPPPARVAFDRMLAAPKQTPDSAWRLRRLLGEIPQRRARMGVKTALNKVFLVKQIKPTESEDEVQIFAEGYYTAPERRRQDYVARIEKRLLRPLIRGQDIDTWRYRVQDYIIWTHDDATGQVLKDLPPKAKAYFQRHEKALKARSDYRDKMPIWQIFRVGPQKLKDKVTWQELSHRLEASHAPQNVHEKALGLQALVIPLQTAYLLATDDPITGLILAGWLNSTPIRAFTASFAERARGAYFRHIGWVMGLLPLPEDLQALLGDAKAAPVPKALKRLHRLSQELHRNPSRPDRKAMEEEIDSLVASLYGLDDDHLKALREYLAFIRA